MYISLKFSIFARFMTSLFTGSAFFNISMAPYSASSSPSLCAPESAVFPALTAFSASSSGISPMYAASAGSR